MAISYKAGDALDRLVLDQIVNCDAKNANAALN
jgi:hypothetical protein